METHVRTPQAIFMQPQRLAVPLFQRPYVWNEELQWAPLWDDVARVAERMLEKRGERPLPHFLGAVVLQQIARPSGLIQERTIIDGQQRLTTLQVLMDALHAELEIIGAQGPALRIEPLIKNANPFCTKPEDQFKVWPTNKDRPAFNAVMAAPPPVRHDTLPNRGERIVDAHRFFSEQARQWLAVGGHDQIAERATAIETAVREHLQMVVIDLGADENAQEIFETLNARGTPLTAADLIKNLVFQRLLEDGGEVEKAYELHWKEFETGFWEAEVSVGRLRLQRSAIFLNHWLIARTGQLVVAREVFPRFKRFAADSVTAMPELLARLHAAALVYRQFVASSLSSIGPVDRLALFGYRTGVMESEVIKPLVLCLLDPQEARISDQQLSTALEAVESWMVRRMLVRVTTKAYNQIVAELVTQLRAGGRARAGDLIRDSLAGQKSESSYWPDDDELRAELRDLLAYRRLSRARLRMVLEALEDDRRGWRGSVEGVGSERVSRAAHAIEHLMPRKWSTNWPLPDGRREDPERDRLVHTLGNLTLLKSRLNSKVSNGPWLGADGKREALAEHDVLMLNRDIRKQGEEGWTDSQIGSRTRDLIERLIQIWPVPPGHKSDFARDKPARKRRKLQLVDLLSAGVLVGGTALYPRRKKFSAVGVTLLADGSVDVDGAVFESPSRAATSIAGKSTNGWSFFLVDQASKRSLRDVRRDYLDELPGDVEDEDDDDDEDEQ